MSTEQLLKKLIISQPEAAAKILVAKPVSKAIAAITLLEGHHNATLFQYIPPRIGAQWLISINSSEHIKNIIGHLDIELAVQIIAAIPLDSRQIIFDSLTDKIAKKIQTRIQQQHKWIGDFIDDEVLTLTPTITILEAKALINQHATHITGDKLFVLDTAFKLVGQIHLIQLLNTDDTITIKSIMQPISHSVNVQSELNSIANADIWQEQVSLPVIDVENRFIGLVKRSDLEQYAAQTLSVNTFLEDFLLSILDLVQIVWTNTISLLSTGLSGPQRRP